MFSSADELLNDEMFLQFFGLGSLVTLHTFMFTHILSVLEPVHIPMVSSRVSKNCLKAELCFHYSVHFIFHSIHYIHIF